MSATRSSAPSGTTSTGRRTPEGFGRAALTAVVGAAVGVLLTHLLFDALGADFRVAPPGAGGEATVTALQAAVTAGAAVALGCGVAWLLARLSRTPDKVFLVLVVLVVGAYGVMPLLAGGSTLTTIALEVEHVVTAGVAVAVLLPVLRRARR